MSYFVNNNVFGGKAVALGAKHVCGFNDSGSSITKCCQSTPAVMVYVGPQFIHIRQFRYFCNDLVIRQNGNLVSQVSYRVAKVGSVDDHLGNNIPCLR